MHLPMVFREAFYLILLIFAPIALQGGGNSILQTGYYYTTLSATSDGHIEFHFGKLDTVMEFVVNIDPNTVDVEYSIPNDRLEQDGQSSFVRIENETIIGQIPANRYGVMRVKLLECIPWDEEGLMTITLIDKNTTESFDASVTVNYQVDPNRDCNPEPELPSASSKTVNFKISFTILDTFFLSFVSYWIIKKTQKHQYY